MQCCVKVRKCVFSSSMASAAAHGSDSHDAPLLFVLLCESSVRLCLPRSFLSARCLRGKVLLFSFSTALDLSRASIHSTHWTALFTSFSPSRVAFYLPRKRCRPALLLKMWTHSRCPLNFFSLARLCFKSFISFSLCSFSLLFHLVSAFLFPTLPSVCKSSLDLPFAFVALNGQTLLFLGGGGCCLFLPLTENMFFFVAFVSW